MAWESTWLFRVKDCYLVPWKVNDEAIDVDTIPARAFDSPEEKQRVAAIIEQYNDDLTLTQEEDDAFAQIARERAARHPLRTWLWIPAARAVVIWFTPRIELLPISGNVFPLAQKFDEDPADQAFTILLFLLNIVYVGLAVWGFVKLWRSRSAVSGAPASAVSGVPTKDRQSPDWRSPDLRSPGPALLARHFEPSRSWVRNLSVPLLGLRREISAPSHAPGAPVRPALAFLFLFLLLRTAFLTTLETPEPRYVLVCFPILIALAAQLFAGKPASAPPA
jgi:hypothetical protein